MVSVKIPDTSMEERVGTCRAASVDHGSTCSRSGLAFSKEAGSGGQLGKVWVTTQAGRVVTNVELIQASLIWSLQACEI